MISTQTGLSGLGGGVYCEITHQ